MIRLPSLPSTGQVFAGALHSARRFPLPLGCALLWCLAVILAEHDWDQSDGWDLSEQASLYLLFGFFWSLAITLFGESRGWGRLGITGLAAVGLLLLLSPALVYGGYWFRWQNPSMIFLLPGLLLLPMAAPFLRRGPGNRAVWEFNRASWVSVAFGLLIALVASLGLMAVLYALEELFGLKVDGEAYRDIWIVGFGLLAPWQALSGVPRSFAEPAEDKVPNWIAFLASYLLVPLVAIYLLLIYAYIGKIIVTWTLPRGQVAWLVSGFAVAGVVTQLFSHPLAANGRPWVKAFQHHFYRVLLPPTILLWIAVATRVGDYGLTESRYLLALFAFWLTLLCFYFILPGRRLVLVPLSLALLLILASAGPWSAAQVSSRSQVVQLTSLLERHHLLRDGRMVPAGKDLPFADQKRIGSILRYFDQQGRRAVLAPMLVDGAVDPNSHDWAKSVMASMDLDLIEEWKLEGAFDPTRRAFDFSARHGQVLEVTGYDRVISDHLFESGTKDYGSATGDRYSITLDQKAGLLLVSDDRGHRLRFDVGALAEQLRSAPVPREALQLDTATGGLEARLLLRSLKGRYEDQFTLVRSIEFSLLLVAN